MARYALTGFFTLTLLCPFTTQSGEKSSPVKVKVEWDKDERVDAVDGPLDGTPRINPRRTGVTMTLLVADDTNRRLDMAHIPTFKIDGVVMNAGGFTPDGRSDVKISDLTKRGGKDRIGYAKIWTKGDLEITQSVEVVAGRPMGDARKRQLDAVIIHYAIENKGKAAHTVGMRTFIDQRYGKLTSPLQPGKTLDGVDFKAGAVPAYLQVQPSDAKKAKFKGTLATTTHNVYIAPAVGGGERPERVIVSSALRTDVWELPVMAGGANPAVMLCWEPKELRAGGKRDFSYGYGTSVATAAGADVNFKVDLSGSFEVGKTFTIAAQIFDPYDGQTLEIEMPKGLELREGKAIQPVPTAIGAASASLILWKGRVLEYGRFPVRIRSSAGVTRTMFLTIGPA